jgi:hypothetical protein
VSFAVTSARGGVSFSEDPQTPGRYYLGFIDAPIGGSANYDVTFEIAFADGSGEIPEPGTAWLLLAGALGLGLLRRR